MKSLAFTGHRPAQLGGYDENNPLNLRIKSKLKELILQSYKSGYQTFITGMAMGVDQWAGQIVVEMKQTNPNIRLIAAIPFAGQPNIWYQKSQQDWLNLLTFCDEIYLVDQQPSVSISLDNLLDLSKTLGLESKYLISKKLNKRNEWMVDRADSILAVFKQIPGGTENCVQYAKSKGKRIVSYNPDDETVTIL